MEEVVKELCQLMQGWGIWDRPYELQLPDGSKLCLTISHKMRAGWRLKVDKKRTSCPECGREIKQLIVKKVPSDEVSPWLSDVVETHNHHNSSVSVAENQEGVVESRSVKIHPHPESAGPRIKVKGAASIKEPRPAASATLVAPKPLIRIVESTPDANISHPPPAENRHAEERIGLRPQGHTFIFPGIGYQLSSGDRVEVILLLSVCKKLIEHCSQSLEHGREVGGLLIGHKEPKPLEGAGTSLYRVCVTNLIEFRAADSSGAHLHLDHDSWAYVYQKESEAGYEGEMKVRLGWYHTHPTQGIFFSRQDHGFHEVFDQPHQFALVVDPRNMEAGLFYWDNDTRHSLTGAVGFKLLREPEAGVVAEPTGKEPPPVGERDFRAVRAPLAIGRFFAGLFAALMALVLALYHSVDLQFRPEHLSILALVTVLEFRLWNIGWFHPESSVETALAASAAENAGHVARASGRALVSGLKRIPARLYKYAFAVLIICSLLAVVILWSGRAWKLSRTARQTQQPAQHPANDSNAFAPEGKSSVVILVKIDSSAVDRILFLESQKDRDARIEYLEKGASGNWTCDDKSEEDFFRKVFQWEIKGGERSYIREFQKSLAKDDTSATTGYDGKWGPTTRKSFLRKVLDSIDSRERLEIPGPTGKPVYASFKK
jgi:proteasome lid subunit RPN8/RPN11